MKRIIILIPVFNDWESLKKLLGEINNSIQDIENVLFNCLIINDASTIKQPLLKKPDNINSIKVLNMKENKGHARCNAFGLRYICEKENFEYVILMDGDGEDRPTEIKSLVKKIKEFPNKSVVAKRVKRSEGTFFQFLYRVHKLLTIIFTGKNINFGNYSCLLKSDAKIISNKASLWSSFSGTVKKNLQNLNEIESIRGSRYFGPSQMSLLNLLIHSFSIIAVFKYQVLIRSIIIILIFTYLFSLYGLALFTLSSLIMVFNVIIFITSLREKEDELKNSHNNLVDVIEVTH